MKYSVLLKLVAILLCTAMLLCAAVSGLAMFALNEAGLYQQPYQQAYARYRADILEQAAQGIVQRYAARELGGLDDQMADHFYGADRHLYSFRFGAMGYTLRDSQGKEVETWVQTGTHPENEFFTVAVASVPYPSFVSVQPAQIVGITEPQPLPTSVGTASVFDAIPPEGAAVHNITVSYPDSSEGVGSPASLGNLFHNPEGFAQFHGNSGHILDMNRTSEIISIRFENETLGLLYEITDPAGVGLFWTEADGSIRYLSNVSNPDFVQEPIPQTSVPQEDTVPTGAILYAAPSEGAPVVGTLDPEIAVQTGEKYEVNGEIWYLFPEGWVSANAVGDPSDEAPVAARVVLPQHVDVYSIPNRNGAPAGILEAGTQVEIIRTVSVEGENWCLLAEGWIPEAFLDALPGETVESSEPVKETEALKEAEAVETVAEPSVAGIPEPPVAQNRAAVPGVEHFTYYDRETHQEMVLEYTMEEAKGFEVRFTLGANALEGDIVWKLLAIADNFRQYLIPAMLGSVLVFVLLVVYLCCAAGRRPGTREIRAGGLNRLPLDVYVIALCCAETLLAFLIVEGVPYLMAGSLTVGLSFGAAVGYGAVLLAVAFCFACAAQLKAPGGFWWRNLLLVRCWKLCLRFTEWIVRNLEKWMLPLIRRILRALWKFIRTMTVLAWQGTKTAAVWLRGQYQHLKEAAVKFWEKLPMTWQWLLTGFVLIIVLALTVNTPIGFWGILATVALVLYGAHAFGTLLGGVKRMNKGDLGDKVDDKLLIGSFRNFAEELNGLADVAMVAAQKQLKSERMRTELITNVSHDIKTPLTSIINYVDLLKKTQTDEQQQAYLEVLSRQSQRLKKLVEDLMELSKASTGNMPVEIGPVDAVEAVTQALGEFSDKLEQADLYPVFRQSGESLQMLADGRLLWRVLSNLLSNAVKYAQPGTRLYVDVNRVEDQVILSVKNISREELNVSAEELLERFVRGDVSRNTDGSGLGLNIAQSLMQLQKGELQLLVDGDLFKVTLIFPAA